MSERKYDSTVARIAGNIMGGAIKAYRDLPTAQVVCLCVRYARDIVAEVKRTEHLESSADPVVAERERIVKFLQDVYNASTHGASTLMLHAIDAVQANNMSSPQAVARPEGKS